MFQFCGGWGGGSESPHTSLGYLSPVSGFRGSVPAIFVIFTKVIGTKGKNKVSTSYKTVLPSKIFPKHDLLRSFRERSILVVRIEKFEPLREPIRKLLFSADQLSHITGHIINRYT